MQNFSSRKESHPNLEGWKPGQPLPTEEAFPGEVEATTLLSKPLTRLQGMEMVLGRQVDTKEIMADELLKDIYSSPLLSAGDRYGLLLLLAAGEQNKKNTNP